MLITYRKDGLILENPKGEVFVIDPRPQIFFDPKFAKYEKTSTIHFIFSGRSPIENFSLKRAQLQDWNIRLYFEKKFASEVFGAKITSPLSTHLKEFERLSFSFTDMILYPSKKSKLFGLIQQSCPYQFEVINGQPFFLLSSPHLSEELLVEIHQKKYPLLCWLHDLRDLRAYNDLISKVDNQGKILEINQSLALDGKDKWARPKERENQALSM